MAGVVEGIGTPLGSLLASNSPRACASSASVHGRPTSRPSASSSASRSSFHRSSSSSSSNGSTSPNAVWLRGCLACSLDVPWMFPECSLNVPWIFGA